MTRPDIRRDKTMVSCSYETRRQFRILCATYGVTGDEMLKMLIAKALSVPGTPAAQNSAVPNAER